MPPLAPATRTDLKMRLWAALRAQIAAELAEMTRSQKTTHAGATHEEAKPENSKDTRALEQTYLARGLAGRVAELRAGLAMLEAYAVKTFEGDDPIAITALVRLQRDDDEREMIVLIAPFGGGTAIEDQDVKARAITPESPLGRALLGRRVGDEAEIGGRALTIVGVL